MDNDICNKCSLPTDLDIYDQIVKEQQKIIIRQENVKYRKWMTVIEGLDQKNIDIKGLTKRLKRKFCCGGTFKNGIIKLQGKWDLKKALEEEGVSQNNIIMA
jgi:translation initiation factor 1